ncbi:hypothetical protein AAFF_G00426370 [Aldrovandia affinis]|uniref:Uncharacterized protein n=1 Tax=Aldrovandia affinis TaxID=143900 RepID=A0AAD7WIP3_9TELE|nr:hypothetical protein AAFF_G00426370 [Aldrovandia affinis]
MDATPLPTLLQLLRLNTRAPAWEQNPERWPREEVCGTGSVLYLHCIDNEPIMAAGGTCWVALALMLLCLAPPAQCGCLGACRCSFATLQCVEPNSMASIPVLAPQESENVTEM